MSAGNLEKFYTKVEAAEYCRCSVKSIERAVARGALRPVKNGIRKVLFSESELIRFMSGEGLRAA